MILLNRKKKWRAKFSKTLHFWFTLVKVVNIFLTYNSITIPHFNTRLFTKFTHFFHLFSTLFVTTLEWDAPAFETAEFMEIGVISVLVTWKPSEGSIIQPTTATYHWHQVKTIINNFPHAGGVQKVPPPYNQQQQQMKVIRQSESYAIFTTLIQSISKSTRSTCFGHSLSAMLPEMVSSFDKSITFDQLFHFKYYLTLFNHRHWSLISFFAVIRPGGICENQ